MKPILALATLSLLFLTPPANAAEPQHAKVAANQIAEFEFVTAHKRADPFNEVVLDVIFTEPGGKTLRVPAFWDGERVWKVRYSSAVVGTHPFHTESSDARDVGLHGITGSVEVTPYTGDHPLYKHGRLMVSKDGRFFQHADGTPFLWFGDTWWMGLTKRLSFPDEFNTLLADRKKKGFNVIQIVAGLYPDMPAFDPRGENETGTPWEKDYKAIRPEYFDAADKRIMRLVEEGITPCIVSAWGYHLPFLGAERMKQHHRYVYARWGALPIVWCVAGEFNLPYYLEPNFPSTSGKQAADWEAMLPYIRSINVFDRLITAHPWLPNPMSARDRLKQPTLLDFDMLQTGHGQLEILGPTVEAVRHSYAAKPAMPVVNAEPSYEMLLDKTPAEIARLVFWASWTNGVKGYTYGANGIWQVNGKTKPYGKSPHGGDYGKIPWEDAMNFAGSTQVSLGVKLMAQYPWQRFEPQPGWAAWAKPDSLDAHVGDWIWFPEGDATVDAPVAPRFFRRVLDLPADAKVNRAVLRVAADDGASVWLNGDELGPVDGWRNLREFDGVAGKLKAGRNVIAVRAENLKADVAKNPAGLAVGMAVELEGRKRIEMPSSADWRVSRDEAAGWQKADFDDAAWSPAKVAAPFGGGPWGAVSASGQDPSQIPYAMGIAREVRMIYVLKPGAITMKELEPDITYRASHFDPVTGERKDLGEVRRDAAGEWRCETPAGVMHDWMLIFEAKRH